MTKLISGRVKKISSANVSASRYQFLRLEEAEPDLGVPAANGYVLTSNTDGTRAWVTVSATANIDFGNVNSSILPAVPNAYDLGSQSRPWRDLWLSGYTIRYASSNGSISFGTSNTLVITDGGGNVIFTANSTNIPITTGSGKLQGGTGVSYDSNSGTISIGQNVSTTANVTFGGLTVTGQTFFYGNVTTYNANNLVISDNMIYLNANAYNFNPDLGIAFAYNDGTYHHAGFFRDHSDGRFKVFDNYAPEPDANIFIQTGNTTFRLANIQATTFFGNVSGNTVVTNYITSSNIITNSIYSNVWNNLYTANVIESGSNLYYTNTRVISAVTPYLTTANVNEVGSNLYYTNTRVYSNVVSLIATLTTSNINEGSNLYYTNARVYSNVVSALTSFTTSNINEGSNLYYTNARVYSNVISLLATLTTSNINEGSNLYFTNTRARLAHGAADQSIIYYSSNGNIQANIAFITAGLSVTSTGSANVANFANTAGFANTSGNANIVLSLSNFTTSNLAEGSNLYYTNTRVRSAIGAGDQSIIYYSSNGSIIANVAYITSGLSVTSTGFANVANFANTAGNANIVLSLSNFTTSNLAEGSNLYYTNNRVYSNLVLASIDALRDVDTTTVAPVSGNVLAWNGTNWVPSSVTATGSIQSANFANTATTANVALFAVIAGNANVAIFAANSGNANIVLSLSNFTTSNLAEGSNLYYTNARVYSVLTPCLLVKANVTDLTTANVLESSSNLYYTNARVYANVSPLLVLKANVVDLTTANVTESVSNLYYTNTRAYANLILASIDALRDVDTTTVAPISGNVLAWNGTNWVPSSVIATASVNTVNFSNTAGFANLANFANTTSFANVSNFANTTSFANVSNFANTAGNANIVLSLSNFTTSNLAEGSNLYYTNTRVYSNVIALLNGNITIANLSTTGIVNTNYIQANIWQGIYTANVIESASNLYFTNARVYANVAPLLALKANIVDLTTSNVVELNNLYYTNTRVYSNVAPLLVLKANVVDLTTSNVIELNNLYYTNTRVYSNVAPLLALKANVVDLTTSNVAELNNLYYTNTRVYSNVAPLLVLKANVVDLTTSNVAELNNLYYTNSRVLSYLTNLNVTLGNTIVGNLFVTGTINEVQSNLLYVEDKTITLGKGASDTGLLDGAGIIIDYANVQFTYQSVSNRMALNKELTLPKISADTVAGLNYTGLYSHNVIEDTNLFYSNDRVYSNISLASINVFADVDTVTTPPNNGYALTWNGSQWVPNVVTVSQTELANVANTVLGIVQGSIVANVAVYSANAGHANVAEQANVANIANLVLSLSNFTTSNLAEGYNLYYTNSRVRSNVVALLPTLAGQNILIDANGIISANLASVTIGTLYASNIIENGNTTTGNVYFTNTRARGAISAGDSTIFYDAANGTIRANTSVVTTVQQSIQTTISNLTTSNVAEGSNLYYTNARVYSNVIDLLNTYTTSNINEGSNLYYTNNRVYSNVIALLNTYTTSNINEGSNLYYTNARVISAVTPYLTTANVIESNSNLYYTNTRVLSYLSNLDISLGNVTVLGNLYIKGDINEVNSTILNVDDKNIIIAKGTPNQSLADGAGLIIDGAQANLTYVSTGDKFVINKGLDVLYGTLNVANISSVTWTGLYTANVIESASNLYYTNARVYSNVTALLSSYSGNIHAGNITTSGTVEYGNVSAGTKVVQVYNSVTNSLDTIFV